MIPKLILILQNEMVAQADIADSPRDEMEALWARVQRLCKATLYILGSPDPETVLQGVADSARTLTGASHSVLLLLPELGDELRAVTSGIPPEAGKSAGPGAHGLPVEDFLEVEVRHDETVVGTLVVRGRDGGGEFTPEDRETLSMFAAPAALAISNAFSYGAERRAKDDLQALVDTSPVGVMVFDARTGRLKSLNRESRRIAGKMGATGRTVDEVQSEMTFRRPDGQVMPMEERPLSLAITTGETVRAQEVLIEAPDGQTMTALINTTPIRSEDGEVVSLVATIQDMTPVEELERQRSEFLGTMSQELRVPVSTVKGATAAALRYPASMNIQEMRHFLQIIDTQTDEILSLISDLTDMSRIESGALSIAPEPQDTRWIIDAGKNAFLRKGGRNPVEVLVDKRLPKIEADPERMAQVLSNLLSFGAGNAPEDSLISVAAQPTEGFVEVSVCIPGVKLSQERIDNIFRKFTRSGDQTGTGGPHGASLGMAICKGIVESHGGRIRAEGDEAGRALTITFTVPRVQEKGRRGLTTHPQGPGSATGAGVLAMSDDPQTLWLLRRILADAAFNTVVSDAPSELDALVTTEKPDLIILDTAYQEGDGFDMARRIAGTHNAPVIFVTSRGSDQEMVKAFESGAADYIAKPFSPVELIARVNLALGRSRNSSGGKGLERFSLGDLRIDYASQRVTLADQPASLTPMEYKLLVELSINAGRVLTKETLMKRVWGQNYSSEYELLRTFIKNLRGKLSDSAERPRYILTESRVGYWMTSP